MGSDKHTRLAMEALQLKRAWLLAAAIIGRCNRMTQKDFAIPNYLSWENKSLKRHIEDLEEDFEDLAKIIFQNWKTSSMSRTTELFANQFEAWEASRSEIFDLGRVQDFEKNAGPLGFRKSMDCPAYAQILLQGFSGAAIRHPEYHLASDLALLYTLFLESQHLMDEAARQKRSHSSEHNLKRNAENAGGANSEARRYRLRRLISWAPPPAFFAFLFRLGGQSLFVLI